MSKWEYKSWLKIYTKDIEKYLSDFSDKIILQSNYSVENMEFEFNIIVKGYLGPVSSVKVEPVFFKEVKDPVRYVSSQLLEGYIKYLESGFFRDKSLSKEDVAEVFDRA